MLKFYFMIKDFSINKIDRVYQRKMKWYCMQKKFTINYSQKFKALLRLKITLTIQLKLIRISIMLHKRNTPMVQRVFMMLLFLLFQVHSKHREDLISSRLWTYSQTSQIRHLPRFRSKKYRDVSQIRMKSSLFLTPQLVTMLCQIIKYTVKN